ncbi:hypothetical protein L204_105857 [Cryptococcus depauperatus]|nr:hypothetical protein L204_06128 [Cryptococcus depauperatus CBS 7855]
MDYLTLLTTCSLTLFTSAHPSPCASPATPKTSSVIAPSPVSIPIFSILNGDTETAWFLLTHVLASHPGQLTNVDKQIREAAEVLVWREMDRANMCIRALGSWFESNGQEIGMCQLEKLAKEYGVGVAFGNEKGSSPVHPHTSCHERGMEDDHEHSHSYRHGICDDAGATTTILA